MKFIKKNIYKILIALSLCFTITLSIFGISKTYADDTQNESNIGYEIDTPDFSYGYANLNTLGGMSYMSENLISVQPEETTISGSSFIYGGSGIFTDINEIPAGTYTFKILANSSASFSLRFKYTDDTEISFDYTSISSYKTFTAEKNINGIRSLINGSASDIKVMLVRGSVEPTTYQPYFEGIRDSAVTSISSIIEFDIPSDIQNITGYGWGINNNCYNYIDFTNYSFVKKVSRVDLGSLNWFKYINNNVNSFYCQIYDKKVGIGNVLCDKYNISTNDTNVTSIVNYPNTIGQNLSNNYIYFYSDSTINMSIPEFRDFINGTYLYYELETQNNFNISSYINTNQIPIKNDVDLILNNQYYQSVPYNIDFDMGNDNLLCPYNLVNINNESYYVSYNKFDEHNLIRGKYDLTGTFIDDNDYFITDSYSSINEGKFCISNNVNNINFQFILFDYEYTGGNYVYTYLDTLFPNQYGIVYFDVNGYTYHNLVFKLQFYYVGDYNDKIMINNGFFPRYYMESGTFRSPVAYAELQNQYNQLQANYNQLQRDYDDLQSSYDSLNDNYDDLLDLYNETSGHALANILNGTTISAFNVNGPQYATDTINNVESNYYSFSVNNSTLYNQVVNHSTNTMLYINTYISCPFNFINNNNYGIFIQLWNNTLIETINVDSNSSVLIEPRTNITQMRVGIFGNGTADFAFTTAGYGDAYNNGFQNGYASNKRLVDDLSSRIDTLTNNINVLSSSYNDLQSSYENLLSGNNFSNLFFTIAQTPFESFKQIWNVDFLGVNLSGFVTGILFIGLIIWLIKKVF